MESATFPEKNSTSKKKTIFRLHLTILQTKINLDWIKVAWQNDKVKLMPGDSVIIKEKTGTINVQGQVYNPGLTNINLENLLIITLILQVELQI